jgi:hypothetical protein
MNSIPMPEPDTIAEPIPTPEPAIPDTIIIHGALNPNAMIERSTWHDLKRKLGG